MTESDLKRMEELFQVAIDLPEHERAAYLDCHCDDPELRTRLAAMLAESSSASLSLPGLGGGPTRLAEGPGSIIGRYKLLQRIGEGGFGVVYMAEQTEPVIRKVALKIIKLGMDTAEVVARFEAERQALAMMDHPNIARVLDGGATDTGRPFFVMELVRGVSITEYCDKVNLSTNERLELFVAVCQAVQHAHQKGVIHRDLKPSNVMVTLHDGTPVPKVIDFGIVKAMNTRLTEKTLFTEYERFIGTPAYMSPEQAEMSGLDVDTRTDIYSLGVVLYELLTGSTPFDADAMRRQGLLEIQRIIREEHPPRPSLRISTSGTAEIAASRRLDVEGLCRVLKGDLDWIVMKALEKDRTRRYASASELAEDLRRHLADMPVVAGPPSTSYRVRKFLMRNRAAVLSVTVIALVLVGGTVGTTLGMLEASREAVRAQAEADNAQGMLDFLINTLALADPEVALEPDPSVRMLLDRTSASVATALAGQPLAEARVRATIGRAYLSLNEAPLAEPHLRRAVELADALEAGTLSGPRMERGEQYTMLWSLTHAAFSNETPDAFACAQRAHEVGLAHLGATYPELADVLSRFGVAVAEGAWSVDEDAMLGVPELFEESVAATEAVLPVGDPLWRIVADRYMAAGYTVWYTIHDPLTEPFFGQALKLQSRELPVNHPDLAETIGLFVGALNRYGKADQAEALMRQSIESLRAVLGDEVFAVANARSVLGENLVAQGRYAEAAELLLPAHEVIMATIGDEANWGVTQSLMRLIDLYDGWGRPDEGRAYRDVIARTSGSGKYVVQWPIVSKAFGPEHAELQAAMARIDSALGGMSYLSAPGTVTAEGLGPQLDELFELRRSTLPDSDLLAAATGRLMLGWANALDPEVHLDERSRLAEHAAGILAAWSHALPVEYAAALATQSRTARARGQRDAAARLARASWTVIDDQAVPRSWFSAAVGVRVGRNLAEARMYHEAEAVLLPCYATLSAQLGPGHSDTRTARALIHDMYLDWGRADAAAEFVSPSPER